MSRESMAMRAENEVRILERRAAALATVEEDERDGDALEVIVIRCGGSRFAIETRWVEEVRSVEHLTPVPGAAAHWAGLINLRGVVRAVVDGTRFLRAEEDRSDVSQVVMIGKDDGAVGFLVDEVVGLDRVAISDLRPPSNAMSSRSGITQAITSAMVPLLDVENILNSPLLQYETREEEP